MVDTSAVSRRALVPVSRAEQAQPQFSQAATWVDARVAGVVGRLGQAGDEHPVDDLGRAGQFGQWGR